MSDRDAFGREKGEDSLANMGWTSSAGPATPKAAPTPTPAKPTLSAGDLPPDGPAPAWTPGPRQTPVRRRRSSAGFWVGFIVLSVIGVSVAGAFTALHAGSNALDGITSSIDAATNRTTTTSRTPSEGASLMAPKALKAALAKLP